MNKVTRILAVMLTVMAAGSVLAADAPPTPAPAPAGSTPSGPRIKFASLSYDFGKVTAGEPVKYSFIFTNVGDELLILTNVQPSCGCTTAGEWTRQVEPGHTGTIPLQFNSSSYGGQVLKTIHVTSNDRTQPSVMLQLKGNIWKPIDVTPPYGVLNVTPDATNATATVRIVNNTDGPITLSQPECNNRSFSVELKAIQPGKEFQLLLATVPPLSAGSVQGQVTLRTSLTNVPVISVPTWINVQPPLSIIPPQVNLGQAPLANKLSSTITLINNSAAPMTLSEPTLNIPGVEPQIAEVQSGRTFTVTMVFPQGFEIPAGQRPEFSVKTSNPKVPLIRVPIFQVRPPANQPVANQPRPALYPKLPPVPTAAQAVPTAR